MSPPYRSCFIYHGAFSRVIARSAVFSSMAGGMICKYPSALNLRQLGAVVGVRGDEVVDRQQSFAVLEVDKTGIGKERISRTVAV